MIAKILALGALPVAFGAVAGDWPSGGKHHDWAPSVTSTVYATSTYTVSSCAPEKTDCPLRGKGPVVVTEVKPLYTTVCPAEEATSTKVAEAEWGCSTSTSYSECVHTITSTLPPVVVTTKIPTTTVTKTDVETEYSTCVHTVTTASWPYVVTTLIPTHTVTKAVTHTEYSTCVHTVTNATTVYPVTTSSAAATYTACPVKPTGGAWPVPVESEAPGSWPAPAASSWAAAPSAPAASWPAGAAKPTASWTKTASPAAVTAGAAAFGASGAIKMLGAAAAAAALVL
jgi:hypothetical protein